MEKSAKKSKESIRLAILISGNGSNMQNIVEYCQKRQQQNPFFRIKPIIVLSDQPRAFGLERAQKLGIKALYLNPGKFRTKLEGSAEENYVKTLKKERVHYVVLAGFMRVLKNHFLRSFTGKIINIHPSLLPFFTGLDTYKKALDSNIKQVGASLHLVSQKIDEGCILLQKSLAIEGKNVVELQQSTHKIEHQLFRQWLDLLDKGIFD